jgi:hypothetical protein
VELITAYCGLVCGGCPAYVATQSGEAAKVQEVADTWSKEWGMKLKPEDVLCDGCLAADGRHVGYWSTCEIRTCAVGRDVENCAYCNDYACEKLEKWFANAKEAKETLDQIREALKG